MEKIVIRVALLLIALSLLGVGSACGQESGAVGVRKFGRYSFGTQGKLGMQVYVVFPLMAPSWSLGASAMRQGDGLWDMELQVNLTRLENRLFPGSERPKRHIEMLVDVPLEWRRWFRSDRRGWFASVGVQLSLLMRKDEWLNDPREDRRLPVVWDRATLRKGRADADPDTILAAAACGCPATCGLSDTEHAVGAGGVARA